MKVPTTRLSQRGGGGVGGGRGLGDACVNGEGIEFGKGTCQLLP